MMKRVLVVLIIILVGITTVSASADKRSDDSSIHDMHMMMRFMDHALCVALEGADMQMLGQMGMSEKLDKDAIVHGTIMINDGKAMIKEMLEGRAMRELYKEGKYDKGVMDDLHRLGEKMLEVIEQVEKLHRDVFKEE